MMSPDPLDPRAQALLDAARDDLGPDAAAMARMRARVLGGAAGGVGVAAAMKASAGTFGLGAKLAVVAVAALALGGGTWWVMREPTPSSPKATPATSGVVVTATPSPSPSPSPTTTTTTSVVVTPAPALAARDLVPTENAVVAPGPRRVAPKRSTLADEVALVDDAMAALRRDDPAAALAAADDHVARFGRRGQLAEEATAIRVEALCRLGDGRWAAALDAFDARFPHSAQRPRLAQACKGAM